MNPNENPVIVNGISVSGVIILIEAISSLGQAQRWWTGEDAAAWVKFFNVVLPVVAVWVGAWILKRKVTPTAKPRDEDGTPLTRPDNMPAFSEIRAAQTEAIKINKEVTRGLDN